MTRKVTPPTVTGAAAGSAGDPASDAMFRLANEFKLPLPQPNDQDWALNNGKPELLARTKDAYRGPKKRDRFEKHQLFTLYMSSLCATLNPQPAAVRKQTIGPHVAFITDVQPSHRNVIQNWNLAPLAGLLDTLLPAFRVKT